MWVWCASSAKCSADDTFQPCMRIHAYTGIGFQVQQHHSARIDGWSGSGNMEYCTTYTNTYSLWARAMPTLAHRIKRMHNATDATERQRRAIWEMYNPQDRFQCVRKVRSVACASRPLLNSKSQWRHAFTSERTFNTCLHIFILTHNFGYISVRHNRIVFHPLRMYWAERFTVVRCNNNNMYFPNTRHNHECSICIIVYYSIYTKYES